MNKTLGFFHDIDWPDESRWKLWSLIKSTSISVDEGEETGWRRIFKPWDNWDMDCVCVPFSGWMGKTKYLSAFERGMVVGARCTGLSVSRTATQLFKKNAQQFPVCIKNGPPPKGRPANLTQLWEALESTHASVPVERLSTPCCALTNWGCSEVKVLERCS